jgi:hypothetical protein
MRYHDFELLIIKERPGKYSVRVIYSPAGESEGVLVIDPNSRGMQEALHRLEDYWCPTCQTFRTEEQIDNYGRCGQCDTDVIKKVDGDFLKGFGGLLFQKLFAGRTRDVLYQSLGQIREEGSGLRIRLRIEPPELSSLPWEYLYDQNEDFFLATSPEILVSRYIPLAMPLAPFLVELPLRILVAISSPTDLPPLNVDEEESRIRTALQPLTENHQVELDILSVATRKAIQSKLQDKEYHVFHFIGHGDFSDDRGLLALVEKETGHHHLMDAGDFGTFFLGYRSMRLVVLNACKSAKTATGTAFVGMAPRLVRRGIPAVIAMRFSVPDPTAILFSEGFYGPLTKGYPVDTAVAEARRAILLRIGRDEMDFGIPVLFMRAEDGKIIDFQSQKEERIVDGTQRGLQKIEELIKKLVDERAPKEDIVALNEFIDSLFEFAELHNRLLELNELNKLWRNLISRFSRVSDELRRLRIQGLKPVKIKFPEVIDDWDSSKKEAFAPLLAFVKTARYIDPASEEQIANLEKAKKKIDKAIKDGNLGKLHDSLLEFDCFANQYRADGDERLSDTITRLSALSNRLIGRLSEMQSPR